MAPQRWLGQRWDCKPISVPAARTSTSCMNLSCMRLHQPRCIDHLRTFVSAQLYRYSKLKASQLSALDFFSQSASHQTLRSNVQIRERIFHSLSSSCACRNAGPTVCVREAHGRKTNYHVKEANNKSRHITAEHRDTTLSPRVLHGQIRTCETIVSALPGHGQDMVFDAAKALVCACCVTFLRL